MTAHGLRNGLEFLRRLHRVVDWTDGCIVVTNREIEELWWAVRGTEHPLILSCNPRMNSKHLRGSRGMR